MKLMDRIYIYCFNINYTSSDDNGIIIFNHFLQRRFKDIRIELRQIVFGQMDVWKIACKNDMKLIKVISE